MKNTAVNTLSYTGIVTLSRYIGSKKIKIAQVQNAGTYSLFNFFSDCLLGDFDTAKINRPTKIMLLEEKMDENNEKYYESKSGFSYLISKPEKVYSTTEGIVRYSFVITRDNLEGITFNNLFIGLYANSASSLDPESFMAIVKIEDDDSISQNLTVSSALVVDWELHISNKDKEAVPNV